MNDRTRAEIDGHATASTGHTRHRFCGISQDAPARTRTPLHALDAEADQPPTEVPGRATGQRRGQGDPPGVKVLWKGWGVWVIPMKYEQL